MISRILLVGSLVIALVEMIATSLPASTQAKSIASLPPAVDLVRTTVANELAAANDNSVKHMFRDHKKTPQGSQTRIYVETQEAIAGMTVAYNDKPLTPEQLQGEEGRLAGLVGNSEQLRRKQRQEKEEASRTLSIVKALPDAFLFDYNGTDTVTNSLAKDGMQLVRLQFRPNPEYRPPSHVEEVLVGMAGILLIDPASYRIARIDGTLAKEVSFGWGILGHLNRGGHFFVEQRNLDDGSWQISCMRLQFAGKILLFRNISINSEEVFTNFRRVPANTTFAQGIELLKAEQAKTAQNGAETANAVGSRSH